MVLRVKNKLRYNNKEVTAQALLSTGFETIVPTVSIPLTIAEELGLKAISTIEFEGPGLTRGISYYGGKIGVEVSMGDEVRKVKAEALITQMKMKVLSAKCNVLRN